MGFCGWSWVIEFAYNLLGFFSIWVLGCNSRGVWPRPTFIFIENFTAPAHDTIVVTEPVNIGISDIFKLSSLVLDG